MVPDSVLWDTDLSASARVVYGALARCRTPKSSVAKVGTRWLSEKIGFSRTTVRSAIGELKEHGHITIKGEGRDRRAYRFTSNRMRKAVVGEAGGQSVETYESEDVVYQREVVSRPHDKSA